MRAGFTLTLLLAAINLTGCAGGDPRRFTTVEQPSREPSASWRGLPVRDAQIIVSEKPGALSMFLALAANRYEPWVHAGVVVVDDGQPYVYEAWGRYRMHFRGPPTLGMVGGIRRVTLESFLRREDTIAIHEPPPGVDRSAVVAYAREQLARRTTFDAVFDARDASALYCAEFVARALEAGGGRPMAGMPVSVNRSAGVALRWFEVNAPELLLAGMLLRDTERTALLDRRRSLAEINAYFDRRRELHRRFTANQRLGNLFRWNGFALRFRPRVQAFLDAPADSTVDAATLANRMLGFFDEPGASVAGTDQSSRGTLL